MVNIRRMNDGSLIINDKFNYSHSQDPFIKAVGIILESQLCSYNSSGDLMLNNKRFEALERLTLHETINFFIYQGYIKLDYKNEVTSITVKPTIDRASFKSALGNINGKKYRTWEGENVVPEGDSSWVFIGLGNYGNPIPVDSSSVYGPITHHIYRDKTNSYFIKNGTF